MTSAPTSRWSDRLGLAVAAILLTSSGCLAGPGTGHAASAIVPPAAASTDCRAIVRGIDLETATIADLQRALEAGRLTSVELVDAYLARIAAFDAAGPKLNSIRDINPTAKEQAAALDAERAAGHVRGPLHGIPILLKDNVGTKDQPTTAGSIALEKNVPKDDATLTAKLREAGAIILGKTNLSEFANWMDNRMPSGYSSLGGQVIAPYTMGNPSGSSSGSGVAGAMAFSAGTIGTETSGSILSPSQVNSVVGLKPTLGLISRAGIIPLAANFDTPGPMVRNVADAAAMLSAIAGPDPKDPATAPSATHLPPNHDYVAVLSKDSLRGAKLGYGTSNNAMFQKDMDTLKSLGATLVPLQTNPLTGTSTAELAVIYNEFHFGINDYLAKLAGPQQSIKDLTGIIVYNNDHPDKVKYGQNTLVASDATPGLGPVADVSAVPVVQGSRAGADKLFSDNGVDAIIGPNAPYTGLGAAAGYPTVIVPSGYNGKSPQGLSFFGPAWSEAKILSYAYAYEQATHGRVPPTTINASLLDGVCPGASGSPGAAETFVEATPGRLEW